MGSPWLPHGGGWRAAPGSAATEDLLSGAWESLQRTPGREAFRVRVEDATYFVKRYAPDGLLRRVREFGLRRKPYCSFRRGRRLIDAGVRTPWPVALYLRGGGLPREALLVTEWLEGARHLLVDRPTIVWQGAEAARTGLVEAASLLGGLHRQGFYHGDLHTNVLFAGPERNHAFLIDLDDLRRGLAWRRRVKNLRWLERSLSRLWPWGPVERELFLRTYAESAGLPRDRLERLEPLLFESPPGPDPRCEQRHG